MMQSLLAMYDLSAFSVFSVSPTKYTPVHHLFTQNPPEDKENKLETTLEIAFSGLL